MINIPNEKWMTNIFESKEKFPYGKITFPELFFLSNYDIPHKAIFKPINYQLFLEFLELKFEDIRGPVECSYFIIKNHTPTGIELESVDVYADRILSYYVIWIKNNKDIYVEGVIK